MTHQQWPDFDSKQIYGQLVTVDKNILIPDLCNIISDYALHTTNSKWRFTRVGIDVAKNVPSSHPNYLMDIEILYSVIRCTNWPGWTTDDKIIREFTRLMNWYKDISIKARIQYLIKNLPGFLRAMEDAGFVERANINAHNYCSRFYGS